MKIILSVFAFLLLPSLTPADVVAEQFGSQWQDSHDRVWLGPEYWANPMEDWRVADGRIECIRDGANRNVALLTRTLDGDDGRFEMSVRLGRLSSGDGSAGVRVGIKDEIQDYRAAALRGQGLNAGITTEGVLYIGTPTNSGTIVSNLPDEILLILKGETAGDRVQLTLTACDAESGKEIGSAAKSVDPDDVTGLIALTNNGHPARQSKGLGATARFWFSDWKIAGDAVCEHGDRAWGPILWAMHTVSHHTGEPVMKMTAQMPPVAEANGRIVRLEAQNADGKWQELGRATIDRLSRTATFRVAGWDTQRDVPYRLSYDSVDKAGRKSSDVYTGTVRCEPGIDTPLVVAGFTGNTDTGFPNCEVVNNVACQDPHLLFFSGDQIYEGVGGYGIIREPVEPAVVNYLRKWYLFGWAFGDLMRDRPTLCLPDDHDVYQGNIWGQGGVDCNGMANHAKGGYAQSPEFVNAVQRTQNAHHPDPYDPTPIAQGIGVYYGPMLYGGVSFAVIEDRKFKSGPEDKVNTWSGRPDHVKPGDPPNFDPKSVDKPGLKLLGDRQIEFLRDWSTDWRGAYAKCVLSQTIFCNLANYHGGNQMYLVADLDSNGWPQSGRNAALREMRRGLAFHYAGDQHLPSITQNGIDAWNDAGFAFCVPSIAAGYPRSWRPDAEGRPAKNRERTGGLPNTGEYLDGFGNHITVYGIGNPAKVNRPGRINTLHDKSSGHGIVRFDKQKQTITIECYRLQINAEHPRTEDQFPGWPKTIRVTDNDGREAAGYLPTIRVQGAEDPVIQVINEGTGDIEYTLRVRGTEFRPKVFDTETRYTIVVNGKRLTGVQPTAATDKEIEVKF